MKKSTVCTFLTLVCALVILLPLVARADAGPDNSTSTKKQITPSEVTAIYQTGYDQLKAGQYRDAIDAFKQVVSLDKNHAMAYTNMAYAYRKLGKYKRAVKLYHKALAIDPNLAEAHEYLGDALLELGQIDEAKKHLAILEKLDPKLADELREEIARHERS